MFMFRQDDDGDGMVSQAELQEWQQKSFDAQQRQARKAQAGMNATASGYMQCVQTVDAS